MEMAHRLSDTSWQIQHDDELWEVFRAMGNGFRALLIQASDGKHIWIGDGGESGDGEFYVKPKIMDELQSCGFAKVAHANLPNGIDERYELSYELSEEGQKIYETLKRMAPEQGKNEFLSQFGKHQGESNSKVQ